MKITDKEKKAALSLLELGKISFMTSYLSNMSEKEAAENWQQTAILETDIQSLINKIKKFFLGDNNAGI